MRQRDPYDQAFIYVVGCIGRISRLFLPSYKARGHDETPARQQSYRHGTKRHEGKRPSVIRLLYLQDLHVVDYTEIGLSRLYPATYKARGHDETPEATEPQT